MLRPTQKHDSMAQGFKTKGLQGKTKSAASERKGKGVMKKGGQSCQKRH